MPRNQLGGLIITWELVLISDIISDVGLEDGHAIRTSALFSFNGRVQNFWTFCNLTISGEW